MDRDSFKILGILLFILIIVLIPPDKYYFLLGGLLVTIGTLFYSHIPGRIILKKSLSILPFIVFITIFLPFKKGNVLIFSWHFISFYREGVILFFSIILKAWISLMMLTILYLSIPFPVILRKFRSFGIPSLLITLVSFMYRYIYLFLKIAKDMERARGMRDFGKHRYTQIKAYSNIIGLLFVRAYEKGEGVYYAMKLRGFGDIQ